MQVQTLRKEAIIINYWPISVRFFEDEMRVGRLDQILIFLKKPLVPIKSLLIILRTNPSLVQKDGPNSLQGGQSLVQQKDGQSLVREGGPNMIPTPPLKANSQ